MTVVHEAGAGALPDVLNIIDGAALRTDVARLRAAIDRGAVLVASEQDRVLGALVLDGDRITAIAVRPRRRDQGIGRRLVAAAARRGRLVAEFDPGVRPFWVSLGFDTEPLDGGERFRGVLDGSLDE